MNAVVKRLDKTRPTTGAQNKGQLDRDGKANPKNAAQTLDVVGINYQVSDYDKIRAAYPDKPMVSTEDTSQVMTRGEYANDQSRNVVALMTTCSAGWDRFSSARNSWEAIAGNGPSQAAFSGRVLIIVANRLPTAGRRRVPTSARWIFADFPKTEFYIRQALWVKNKPVLTLVPHWNWAGKEGQPIKVMALTNCDKVALLLNGKPLGEKEGGSLSNGCLGRSHMRRADSKRSPRTNGKKVSHSLSKPPANPWPCGSRRIAMHWPGMAAMLCR